MTAGALPEREAHPGVFYALEALILALAPLPLDLVWCDPRPEAFPTHVPQRVILRQEAEPERILAGAPDDARLLIMTHSHALDLLVVGSRGYGPLKRLTMGSTSAKLVRSAQCPVIVVPRGAREVQPELASLAGAERA